MSSLQSYFEKSLSRNTDGILGILIADFRKDVAQRLLERAGRARLYAHTYTFFFNFKYGCFDIEDLLRFAFRQGLQGISAHKVFAGSDTSLASRSWGSHRGRMICRR